MVRVMHACARGGEGAMLKAEARASQRASEGESLVLAVVGEAASQVETRGRAGESGGRWSEGKGEKVRTHARMRE